MRPRNNQQNSQNVSSTFGGEAVKKKKKLKTVAVIIAKVKQVLWTVVRKRRVQPPSNSQIQPIFFRFALFSCKFRWAPPAAAAAAAAAATATFEYFYIYNYIKPDAPGKIQLINKTK